MRQVQTLNEDTKKPTIVIVGGGLAGLALAAHLLYHGWGCTVLERRSRKDLLADTNSFYDMASSGLQAILRIADGAAAKGIFDAGVTFEKMALYFGNKKVPTSSFEWTGNSLGMPMFNITRSAILTSLCEAVEELDPDCIKFETNAKLIDHKAGTVEVDGSSSIKQTLEADLVVAADGIHSRIRKQLFGDCGLRSDGIVAVYAVLPPLSEEDKKSIEHPSGVGDDNYMVLGIDRDFLQYAVVTKKASIWYANYQVDGKPYVSVPAKPDRPDGWLGDVRDRCHNISIMEKLIARTTEDQIQVVMCCDRPPLDSYHSGKVVLVGDAAHPFTPFAGLGSSQAMVDAFVLAEALLKHGTTDIPEAVKMFETERLQTGNYLMEESRKLGGTSWIDRITFWTLEKILIVANVFGKARSIADNLFVMDRKSMVNGIIPFKSKEEEGAYDKRYQNAKASLVAQIK